VRGFLRLPPRLDLRNVPLDTSYSLEDLLVAPPAHLSRHIQHAVALGDAHAFWQTGGFTAFTLDSNDTIKFDLTVNGKATTVKVDKETVARSLNTTAGDAGTVSTVADYATVLRAALKSASISGVLVSATATNIEFTAETPATVSLGTTVAVASSGASILAIDVTTASTADLKAYLENISTAADRVTSGAALLGAVSSRVELQQTFVFSLVDTIDKGVSALIDANLSDESTRLQALQTKQQLGIQALSIAYSSTQNVLSLFQN
jgi:flagellin